ncbi:MAG TPA: uroporphyrinogen decarboxylase family protein [Armatimonadota bacterium]|nr:uroporphyrinogen decarboxylase family protein [Armatimonadota bacterium]
MTAACLTTNEFWWRRRQGFCRDIPNIDVEDTDELTTAMTSRERWVAALHLQPADRFPFWPKIDRAYLKAQAAPFTAMSVAEFHAWLGSDPHLWTPTLVHEMRATTRVETAREGLFQKTTYHTPLGHVAGIQQYNPATRTWRNTAYPIHSHDGLAIMTAFYEDARPKLDRAAFEKTKEFCATVAQTAVTATYVGMTPFLELVQGMLDPQRAAELLTTYPQDVGVLLEAMHQVMVKRMDYCCAPRPDDVLSLIENTAATPLPPPIYRTFCLPHLRVYAEMARQAGRLLVLLISGQVKALLPDLRGLSFSALEAFTTPPVGDATLAEGRAACPNTCLIGGANAPLWTRPMLEIIVGLDEQFDALPHLRGIVITSGGVITPDADPHKLREVAEWVRAYPMK